MAFENFPTNIVPGSSLTTSWVNGIAGVINRAASARPGSTINGLRFGALQSDNPHERLEVHPIVVLDYFDHIAGNDILVDQRQGLAGPLMVGVTPFIDTIQNIWDADIDQTFEIEQGHYPNQFLIPTDYLFGRWNPLSGHYDAVNPPVLRVAVTDVEIDPGDVGFVRIYTGNTTTGIDVANPANRTDVLVPAWNQSCTSNIRIPAGTTILIGYEQSSATWQIICIAGATGAAQKVHFKLKEALTKADASKTAEVTLVYEIGSPSIGDEINVFNPGAQCGGDDFLFEGAVDCHGQAIYNNVAGEFYIWQIECP